MVNVSDQNVGELPNSNMARVFSYVLEAMVSILL
jgi:hypothetical protein